MQSKATSVAAYIAELPDNRRDDIAALRALVRSVVPEAGEIMRYGMPSYELASSLFCAFAAQKNYTSLYVMDTALVSGYRQKLGKLDSGKGCIRFRSLADVPSGVLREILAASAKRRREGITVAACDDRSAASTPQARARPNA